MLSKLQKQVEKSFKISYNCIVKLYMLLKQAILNSIHIRKKEEWEKLEKILLTTTLSILGGSGIFFTSKGNVFKHTGILGLSWMFLCLSLISLLLSYLFSEWFSIDLIKKVEKQPSQFTETEYEKLINKKAILGVNVTNYTSLASTIIGIILLIVFAYLNIMN